ncbi:MAG: hypothetical protein ACQES9_01700 [Myxococcota bacterium]
MQNQFKYLTIITTIITFLSISMLISCDDDSSGKPLGSECDAETNCQGICNLGLPDGMCVEICDEQTPCEEGTCVDFTETQSFCLPSCQENSECREGYSCIENICRPPATFGGPCEENEDCTPCNELQDCPEGNAVECKFNICTWECNDGNQCEGNTFCGKDDTDAYWCQPVTFEQGPGTAGESCSGASSCVEGFDCLAEGENDPYAYCSNQCETDKDCIPSMKCGEFEGVSYCIKRTHCVECDMDSQCGYQTDKCIGPNPEIATGFNYCSRVCDPDRDGTCPVDNACLEAFYCADSGAWVPDCTWCSGDSCEPGDVPVYQCFHTFGSCVGDGEFCTPCRNNDDCTVENGTCVIDESAINSYCTMPCDANNSCPDHYMCVETESEGYQCVPRTGSCNEPSGGTETCDVCADWSDCIRGGCLPPDGNIETSVSYCLDYCSNNEECGPYATCETVTIYGEYNFDVCLPIETVDSCSHWQTCMEDCPNGPAECTEGPLYCQ